MLFLGITSAVVVGMLVAGQSKVNSRLAAALGDGFEAGVEAALISFGVGFVILCLLIAPVPAWRAGTARVIAAWRGSTPGLTRWQVLGGLSGAFFVASQGLAVATIGVALFVVGIVAGQTTGALVVDSRGIGPAGRRAATPQRVVGAGLAVVAVVLGVVAKVHGSSALHGPGILLLVLPLVAGAGASWQQAVNGRVARVGGSMPATWVNFVVGTAALAVVLLAATLVTGSPAAPPSPAHGNWWLYLGGPIGIAFICLAAWLVHHLGVLLLGLSSVVGQVFGALILDVTAGVHLGALTFVGAALTLVGVGVATVTWNPLSGNRTGRRSDASHG